MVVTCDFWNALFTPLACCSSISIVMVLGVFFANGFSVKKPGVFAKKPNYP